MVELLAMDAFMPVFTSHEIDLLHTFIGLHTVSLPACLIVSLGSLHTV